MTRDSLPFTGRPPGPPPPQFEPVGFDATHEIDTERRVFQAVIETVPVGITYANMDGAIVRANSHALRVLRAPDDDAERLDWRATEAYDLAGRRIDAEDLPLERTLTRGESVLGERLELVAGGGRVVVDISTAPVMDEFGAQIGAVAVLQDVTVRERQERAERDFVTNAAHELQSPLAGILSAIDVLQAGAKDKPERDIFLGHIDRAATRLARLVRALLILARAQTGYEAPKDELVAIRPLLEDIASTIHVAEGVDLEIDCPAELAVLSNRELLEQALANLAENAAKHTLEGRVVLCARVGEDVAELAVSDTGPGIPADLRSRVLDRFFHGEEEAAGFGLGLSIVRAAVEVLGGELELDSTVGKGTVFRIKLPRLASLVS